MFPSGRPVRKNKNHAYTNLKALAKQALYLIQLDTRTQTDLMEQLEITKNKLYEVLRFMRERNFPFEERKTPNKIKLYCMKEEKPKLSSFVQNKEQI